MSVNGLPKSGTKRVTCSNRKCHERFTIKLGEKNNGYPVVVICPFCGTSKSIKNKI